MLISLPGVPWETEPLIREEVLPYLQRAFSPNGRIWINRILKVCGVGESNVDDRIGDIIRAVKNPVIGLQASPGEIKVRLTAMAESSAEASRLLDEGEGLIRERIGDLIFGYGDETLPASIAGMINADERSLVVVDQVTRGQIAYELGTHLHEGRLKGGLVLDGPPVTEERFKRFMADFGADLGLCVNGHPEGDKLRTEVTVLETTGRRSDRQMILGGPYRLARQRAATMSLFTLFTFLNPQREAAAE